VLYICIPVYNEEQTVGVVLWKIRQVMTEFRRDYQIIVGDDASTDSTPSVLAPYARVLPLTILRNPERRGYAATLEMLLREAVARSPYPKRDVVVTLQADFTDDPADLVALVKQTEAGADIVTGNVQLPDGTARSRRWARAAAAWVARRMDWPDGAGDPISNYRAYRVSSLTRAFEDRTDQRLLSCDGWAANVQLLQAAAAHARRVESVELTERHERLQRETRFDGWTSFRHVLALAWGRAPRPAEVASIAPSESRLSRDGIHIDAASVRDAAAHRAQGVRRDNGARATRAPAKRNGRGERGGGRSGERREKGAQVKRVTGDAGVRAEAGTVERRRRTEKPGRDAERQGRRARQSQGGGEAAAGPPAETNEAAGATEPASPAASGAEPMFGVAEAGSAEDSTVRRRRRSRRGGRRRRGAGAEAAGAALQPDETSAEESAGATEGGDEANADEASGERPKRRRSRRGSRGGRRRRGGASGDASADAAGDAGGPGGSAPEAGSAEQSDRGAAYQDGAGAQRHAS
jgi:hypothetical protein